MFGAASRRYAINSTKEKSKVKNQIIEDICGRSLYIGIGTAEGHMQWLPKQDL